MTPASACDKHNTNVSPDQLDHIDGLINPMRRKFSSFDSPLKGRHDGEGQRFCEQPEESEITGFKVAI